MGEYTPDYMTQLLLKETESHSGNKNKSINEKCNESVTGNENKEIKQLIYEYFVENHSDILIDNMSKYSDLIENDNK